MKQLFLTALLSLPAAAADLTVGPAGSGSQYPTLSHAVANAASGDRILVAAGLYQEPGPLTIDKSLTILGQGSLFTTVELPIGSVHVQNIAAGESVELVGLRFEPSVGRLRIDTCAGSVVLSDCTVAIPKGGSSPAIDIAHSARVLLDTCRSFPGYQKSLIDSHAAIRVRHSTLHVQGGHFVAPNEGGMAGGDGILAESSTVYLAGARVYGSDGGAEQYAFPFPIAHPGGVGLVAIDSQVHVRGGVYSGIFGGAGGEVDVGTSGSGFALSGAGVSVDATSSLSKTPDAVVVGGSNDGYTAAPIEGPGTVVNEPEPMAVVGAHTRTPKPGDTITLRYEGAPGSAAIGFLASDLVTPMSLTGIVGPVQLDHLSALVLPTELLDATGQVLTSLDVPPWPFLVGETFPMQLLTASPGGQLSVSSPLVVGIVP